MISRIVIFTFFIYCNILLTFSKVEGELNLEDFFKENPCIPEPSNDLFFEYISKREIQNEPHTSKTKTTGNYRTELNQLIQYNKLEFAYNVENEEGPVHARIFNISLQIGDEIFYGSGKSKKEAKESAARQALDNTNYMKPPVKMKDRDIIHENSPPTVILNNLGLRHGYKIEYYMVDPMLAKRMINLNLLKQKSVFTNATFWKVVANLDAPPKSPFNVEVDVDGQSFYSKSHSIQSAKHEAATKAINYLKQKGSDKSSVCTTKGLETECQEAKAKLKSPISILYEYAQKRRLFLDFNELEKTGPAHKLVFEMECILGTEKVTAKGKSKKDAKKRVAQIMLEKIPDLDIPDDLNSDQSVSSTTKLKKRKRSDTNGVLDNIVGFFSTSDDKINEESTDEAKKPKKKKNLHNDRWSPMEKLTEIGKALNLDLKSQTLSRESSGFYSLLTMDMNPKHICLGIGPNREISQEYAALYALKFLYELDVLTDIAEHDLDEEKFSFDNFIWLAKDHTKDS